MVADFNKKANKEILNDKLLFKVIGMLFFVVIIFLIYTDIKIYQKKKELDFQINDYKNNIEDIKKSSAELKDEIANSDNTYYLEKIAYEHLNEARPGETVYSFVSSLEKSKTIKKNQNLWDVFTNWLKSKF